MSSFKRILLPVLIFFLFTSEVNAAEPSLLYFHPKSSCSWRVKIALDYKKIPYVMIETDPQQEGQEYAEKNPMQKVPTLTIDGNTLAQTTAILEYLEETRSAIPLLPESPVERAVVRQLVQMVASDIQPLQNGAVCREFDDGEEWARKWIIKGFNGVERLLKKTAGKYCYKDDVTMADVFLYPQVQNARKYNVDLGAYPTIQRVEKNLSELEVFNLAHFSRVFF